MLLRNWMGNTAGLLKEVGEKNEVSEEKLENANFIT